MRQHLELTRVLAVAPLAVGLDNEAVWVPEKQPRRSRHINVSKF